MVALTDESKMRSCVQPRCYMCTWATRAAKKSADVGVIGDKRTANGVLKDAGPRGENCCRNCKATLRSLAERLRMMNATAVQLKIQKWRVSPPSRQCSCCFITYSLASLTEMSRSVMCATPICYTCNDTKMHTSTTEEKAPGSSRFVANKFAEGKRETFPETKKTQETIVVEGGVNDEEGELVEQDICKCCRGKLLPRVKRLQMMKYTAQEYGRKGPPPSRQCACCHITYPSAALTSKSRKLTRVVPICSNCCQTGGSAIYEMLAVSDEFVEAFKIENPVMARLLLERKSNGSIAKAVTRQRGRVIQQATSVKKQAPKPSVQIARTNTARYFTSLPFYKGHQHMVRKHIEAPRLLIKNPVNGKYATSPAGVHTEAKTDVKQGQAVQKVSPFNSRTARWLKQFELVNGKTARERRLEARNETKERRLEMKKQRTDNSYPRSSYSEL